jgi:hypothetical protein
MQNQYISTESSKSELQKILTLRSEPQCYPYGLDNHSHMKRAYFEDAKL